MIFVLVVDIVAAVALFRCFTIGLWIKMVNVGGGDWPRGCDRMIVCMSRMYDKNCVRHARYPCIYVHLPSSLYAYRKLSRESKMFAKP